MVNLYNLYNFEALFREYLFAEKYSPVSIKNYLSDLRHFLGWFFSIFYPTIDSKKGSIMPQNFSISFFFERLTAETITNYRNYLIYNKIPTKTINRRLSTLRKFCLFSFKQGWLKENLTKKIKNISNFNFSGNKKLSEILSQYQTYLFNQKIEEERIVGCLNDIKEFLNFFLNKKEKTIPF
ncbi:MAG: phage integrase SAM-like domain-containing protein [Microgenomates group bacterium]|nr:phage integrase SAM-like domain-containing protein [Microgenomates group bacterium]